MSADVVAVPLVDKYKRDVAPAVAMNYNASAATTRDADRIGRSEGPHGQVEAGSTLLQVVEQARSAMRLAGTLQANGAGSTGRSWPDAAAPVIDGRSTPGNSGASGGW
jgi:hypothetical protein